MKYYKTQGKYKASNLDFNPVTGLGHSYEWYQLTRKFGNVLVLNNYSYSSTTQRHVYKVRNLMNQLGFRFETIEAPKGLQRLDLSIEYYTKKIESIRQVMARKGTRKAKNIERQALIESLEQKIKLVQSLQQVEVQNETQN